MDDARWVIERALVHDINKPFEIMRRNAQKSGLAEEIYSVSAYQRLQPLLVDAGVDPELSEYLVNAGSETGHNSLKKFIMAGKNGFERLLPSMLAEKIVHLADDMTYTNNPQNGQLPITLFLTCWERMLASNFIEKYRFLWNEGLAVDELGKIAEVRDLQQIRPESTFIGNYAELQVKVAHAIARELQLLIDPSSNQNPEKFIKNIVNAD